MRFNTSHVSINQSKTNFFHCKWLVSMHLMFLLIWTSNCKYSSWIMVSIHLMFLLIIFLVLMSMQSYSFNTSHVSINQTAGMDFLIYTGVSIHLMFLLIQWQLSLTEFFSIVSIHLMFLLILEPFPECPCKAVSIHLMFLLIPVWFRFVSRYKDVSIHLMFLLI